MGMDRFDGLDLPDPLMVAFVLCPHQRKDCRPVKQSARMKANRGRGFPSSSTSSLLSS